MTFAKIAAMAAALTAGVALAAPAGAGTIAEFGVPPDASFSTNFYWNQTGPTSGTLSTIDFSTGAASAPVAFNFLGVSGLNQVIPATLTFNGVVTNAAAASSGSTLTQGGLSGSFAITSDQSVSYNGKTYAAGANLLSGAFTNGDIWGPANSQAGDVEVSTTASQGLKLTSDLLGFSSPESFSIELNAIDGPLGAGGGQSLNSFVATGTGSFAANLSIGGNAGGVPEPATWAMMILGMAAVGASLRRRDDALVRA